MSIFGVGPLFVVLSFAYSAVPILLGIRRPDFFSIPWVPDPARIGLGIGLLALGVPFFIWSLAVLNKGFPRGELFTGGPYRMCQHPVYGCWVVFNVFGFFLLLDVWPGLLVPIAMYFTLRLLVRKEERWLEDTFGERYLAYRRATPRVLPAFWKLWS